jgi:hypothetical protein
LSEDAATLQNVSRLPFLNAVTTIVSGCLLYSDRIFLDRPNIDDAPEETA